MADVIRRVKYCYVVVRNQPGQGARVLDGVKKAGVNLFGFCAFPLKGRQGQIDLVTDNLAGVKLAAKAGGWKLSKAKNAFLLWGEDRVGAVADVLGKLAAAKVNVTAAHAVTAGSGRYGLIIWVKPQAYARAAKILRAKSPMTKPNQET